MKTVAVEDAVGMILCHDVTRIVPDVFKGPAFRKGHVVRPEDVEVFLNLGKRYLYVADFNGKIHENEAAERIARAACGPGLSLSGPVEGKMSFSAGQAGLLKVNADALAAVNSIQDIMFATLHTGQQVSEGQAVAGTRIIPLAIDEAPLIEAEKVLKENFPIIQVLPFKPVDVGLVVTGSEVFSGRIEDGFGPVVTRKFEELGSRVMKKILVSDDPEKTVEAIHELLDAGAGFIAVTGGMSVDPDDQTPASIRKAGGQVVTYGAPVLPGAMFMLAYIGDVPIVGLPGCVMYHRASIFDLVVPRILAGEQVERADIVAMGHGGFCSTCKICRYPICGFGK